MSSPTQPRNTPWSDRPRRRAWRLSSASAVPVPAITKRTPPEPADERRQRVEGQVEALLVDQAPDQQHEAAPRGSAYLRPQRVEVGGSTGSRSRGSIPLGIAVILAGRDAEHVGHVDAHVARAGDHVIGPAHHGALGGVDVGLGMVLDPALVAAELGGVHGDQPGSLDLAGGQLGGAGHEPVVGVHQVELEALAQLGGRARACRRSSRRPSARTRWDPWGTGARAPGGRAPRAGRPRRAGDRRPGSERAPRCRRARGSRRAFARGGRGRPRSPAGTPRRSAGRACRAGTLSGRRGS